MPNVIPFPTVAVPLVIRAGAHAVAESVLAPAARFQYPANDLQIARLLYAIESGTLVSQGGDGWTVAPGSPLMLGTLTLLVREGIRTGLVRARSLQLSAFLVRVWAEAAPTHLPALLEPLRPLCGVPALRYRLIRYVDFQRDHALVDCNACLRAY